MDSEFLSTPSARRATEEIPYSKFTVKISIHALREEGDTMSRPKPPVRRHFYPRPPRGGRPSIFAKYFRYEPFLSTPSARRATWAGLGFRSAFVFLSTPSARRATFLFLGSYLNTPISIHALREEGDHISPFLSVIQSHFYPRPPRGGRPLAVWPLLAVAIFLSTPSARRATPTFCSSWASTRFLSTPSARRATRSPPQLRDF